MIYFISGHIDLSYEDFEKYYIPIIDRVIKIDKYPEFVTGDCNGVDKFAMDYIYNNYIYDCSLSIYYMFIHPRNTPGGLSVEDIRNIKPYGCGSTPDIHFIGGFKSNEERDSAMTKASDFDIAFVKNNRWKSGTAQNIKRRHSII